MKMGPLSKCLGLLLVLHLANGQPSIFGNKIHFDEFNGTAGATSFFKRHDRKPEFAFNGRGHWASERENHTMPQAIWYKFHHPVKVERFSFKSRDKNDGRLFAADGPSSYEFFGSINPDCSNELSWESLYQDISRTPFSKDQDYKFGSVDRPDFYSCYGFKVNRVPGRPDGGQVAVISQVRFFGTVESYREYEINYNDYEGTSGSTSFRKDLNPHFAFGGNRYWESGTGSMPQAIWHNFHQPVMVVRYSFKSTARRNYVDGPSKYEFFGSTNPDCSDASSWVVLHQDLSGEEFSEKKEYKTGRVYKPDYYTCYGFNVIDVPGSPKLPGRSKGDKYAVIQDVKLYRNGYIS